VHLCEDGFATSVLDAIDAAFGIFQRLLDVDLGGVVAQSKEVDRAVVVVVIVFVAISIPFQIIISGVLEYVPSIADGGRAHIVVLRIAVRHLESRPHARIDIRRRRGRWRRRLERGTTDIYATKGGARTTRKVRSDRLVHLFDVIGLPPFGRCCRLLLAIVVVIHDVP